MAHHSYEESKKLVYKGMRILGAVTLIEVGFSLLGKGHLISGSEDWTWLVLLCAFIILVLSVYKAYYIVYNFMHMAHEVKGLRWTVLMPFFLIVWAIIAFFHEGSTWNDRRQQIREKNAEEIGFQQSQPFHDNETYQGLM